ncbi:MAG: HD domain-containing protein [Clostridia bacterium]|nr:HD domain-containing protein [Clostridia bacterium]
MSENKNNVLIIDDDVNLMNAMGLVLKKYNINLITYSEPLTALQELRNNPDNFDVLVVNYILSSVKGDEIVKLIRQFNKDIYIILMSSHKELAPSIDIMRSLDIQAFFEKGSNFDDFILLIESGFKHVTQIRNIQQMSNIIDRFGLEFATAVVNTIGARDKYTGDHSIRVSAYATLLAQELKLNEEEVKLVSLAANFHDLGKVGISDSILLKEGKLTEEEYTTIKLHPVIAENILATCVTFKDVLPIIRHHHERIDGKGYPDGLTGETIPYFARLLSVCDTFDAITSRRVYREQATIEEALKEINRVKGTQLDSALVEVFTNMVNSKISKIEKIIKL